MARLLFDITLNIEIYQFYKLIDILFSIFMIVSERLIPWFIP